MRLTLVVAMIATVIGILPATLLGAVGALLFAELHFDEAGLGMAVAASYGATIVASIPAGRLSARLGPHRTMAVGVAGVGVVLAVIAALAHSLVALLALMLAAGVAGALTSVAANHAVATRIADNRRGVAYGVKQSAIPLTGMLAGISVPLIAVGAGWRTAFFAAAAACIAMMPLLWRRDAASGERASPPRIRPDRGLVLVTLASGLGAAGANGLATFAVVNALQTGLSPGMGGLVLGAASFAAVIVRIGAGWLVDEGRGRALPLAAALLVVGAFGYAVLSVSRDPAPTIAGTVVALAGGWGYQGLMLAHVAEAFRVNSAEALSMLRIGPAAGSAVGPLAIGAIASAMSLEAAWAVTGAVTAVTAFMMLRMATANAKARRLTGGASLPD